VHESSIETPSRTLRYSGSERPACRMYQTGVWGTGSLRQAWMKGDFSWRTVTFRIVSHTRTSGIVSEQSAVAPRDTPPEIPRIGRRSCHYRQRP